MRNKAEIVLWAVTDSDDDDAARCVVEELIALLRESGTLEANPEKASRLDRMFQEGGHFLNPLGYISWGTEPPPATATAEADVDVLESSPFQQLADVPSSSIEVPEPTIGLLMAALRRLGSNATRRLVIRRHPRERPSLTIRDEYDLQDIVGVVLRSLFNDVRDEERTPSSGGSSSQIDTYLREGSVAIEIKVTRPGRGERQIKPELLMDIHDYQGHPGVRTVIFAIYDLAETFVNPSGFEFDLSGRHGDVDVHVLVVPWIGPTEPPAAPSSA